MKKRPSKIAWKFLVVFLIVIFITLLYKRNNIFAATSTNNTPWTFPSNINWNPSTQRINQTFWNSNPNDTAIIQALFGYSYTDEDNWYETVEVPSVYTKIWSWYNNRTYNYFPICSYPSGNTASTYNQDMHAQRYPLLSWSDCGQWYSWYCWWYYITEQWTGSRTVQTITWHYLNFNEIIPKHNGHDRTVWKVIILDTDWVNITWRLDNSNYGIEKSFDCLAIISKRSNWTTIYTDNPVFFASEQMWNMILDNVHINWGYTSLVLAKGTASSRVFWSAISTGTKLWSVTKNITLNKVTISNINGNVIPNVDQSNNIFWNLLLNDVTTYNNTTNNNWWLFEFRAMWNNNIVFNNYKSFDNLEGKRYNIMSTAWWLVINNSYFHPGNNTYNIYISNLWNRTFKWLPVIINNVVWDVFFFYNFTTNPWYYSYDFILHNIIWSLTFSGDHAGGTLYWYRKYFNDYGTTSMENWWSLINDDDVTIRQAGFWWDVWCLNWNYLINPTKWNYANSRYDRLDPTLLSITWCITRSNGNTTPPAITTDLKYSYWKDVPAQVAPVRVSGNTERWEESYIKILDIPYNSTQNGSMYIASNVYKVLPSYSPISELTNSNRKINVWKAWGLGNPNLFSAFWPYISGIVNKSLNSQQTVTFTPNEYWLKTIIAQLIKNWSNSYYATHFSRVTLYTWTTPPPPSTWYCHFTTNPLTVQECNIKSWTPMSNYQSSSWHTTPFRILGYGGESRVNFAIIGLNYWAPRTAPQTITYTWQCRYTRSNAQWRQVWDSETLYVYVTDEVVSANDFSINNVWCWTWVNRKVKSSAQEWSFCWATDLTAEVHSNWSRGTCAIEWNILSYTTNPGQNWNDSCIIRIKDDENNPTDIEVTRNWLGCTASWQLIINTGNTYTNDPLLHIEITQGWNVQLESEQLSCVWHVPARYTPTWLYVSWSYNTSLDLNNAPWWCNPSIGVKTVYWLLNNSVVIQDDILFDNEAPKVSVNARYGSIRIYETDTTNESLLSWWQQIKYKRVSWWWNCPTSASTYTNLSVSYVDWAWAITWQVSVVSREWTWRLCIYSGFYDRAGNASPLSSNVYTFPNQGSTWSTINWSITINNNASFTNNTTLNLTLFATWTNQISKMKFSCNWTNRTTEENYTTTKNLNLSSINWCNTNNWSKTIYVQFKDTAGNRWWEDNDSITLDTTRPFITFNSISPDEWWNLSISDSFSWLSWWQSLFYKRNTNTNCPSNISNYQEKTLSYNAWTTNIPSIIIPSPTASWTYYLCIYSGFYDRAGNASLSANATSIPIVITWSTETWTTVTWTIQINNWAPATNNLNLSLWLSSNASSMKFSCNQSTRSTSIPFATEYTLTLWNNYWCNTIQWTKTVYVKFIKGSKSIIRSDDIIYDTTKPEVSATKSNDVVTVTITDNTAWLSWWQILQYKRNDSSNCPTNWYSSMNLNNSAWVPSTSVNLNKPWNWTHYLCIQWWIYDRAGNSSIRKNVWSFCFWDDCNNPSTTLNWCRWSKQPTPILVWENNKESEWIMAFSCRLWESDLSRASERVWLTTANLTWLDCEEAIQSISSATDWLIVAHCDSVILNGVQTLTFLYKQVVEIIERIPYNNNSIVFTVRPNHWLERFINENMISDPVRFDFEWPKTEIKGYEINKQWGRYNIDFKVQDPDNRDEDWNISTCYYRIDFWYWEIEEWTRNCNSMESVYTDKSFILDIRAVDDLWNIWNHDTEEFPLWSAALQPTKISDWIHINHDGIEYFKWSLKLRSEHNNIGIVKCEYTIDDWATWKDWILWDWYCETPSITPNSDIIWNFRVFTTYNEYITSTSLEAVLDDTPPNFEKSTFDCVWDNRCNNGQIQYFTFIDEWIWLWDDPYEYSCIIEGEWKNISCTVTDVNVCDIIWNCYTGDLTSYEINIDRTWPIWRFVNATLSCTNLWENETWLIITWEDLLSWLPINYINIWWWWTGYDVIPVEAIEAWKSVRLRDNVNNYSTIRTAIDRTPPILPQIKTFTWYECSEITAYVDAIDTGCAWWNKIMTSFMWWAFARWNSVQYSQNIRFEYKTTSTIVTWKNISFETKDNLWNSTSGNITIQWINSPVTWKNVTAYVAHRLSQNIKSDINWKEQSEAHAWSCETISATIVECGEGTWYLTWNNGNILHYEYNHWILINWRSDYCKLKLSDDDGDTIITVTYYLCKNNCAPEVNATIIWWSKFVDWCYNTWSYTHANWTFLYDASACNKMPAMQHYSQSNSKYTSWSEISIELSTSGSIGPAQYRISCIQDDTYCSSTSTWWNNIWCDDIYTWYYQNVRWCTRSNKSNKWKCKYSSTWGDLGNKDLNGTRCRRNCNTKPTDEYYTQVLGCVRSNNTIDGQCLNNSLRSSIRNYLFWDPWWTCRRWCSLNLVKPEAVRDRVNECHDERWKLTDEKGWTVCNNMRNARSNWITYNDIITFDLENWNWCAKNWELVPWWSKFQSERTVWIQVKDLDWNISDKVETDVVVYDLWDYKNKKNYSRQKSPVLRKVSATGWNEYINIIVEAEDTWLIYQMRWRKGEENTIEQLIKSFYEEYIQSYSPFNIGKSENSEWFKKWTCTQYTTLSGSFDSPINNTCTCVWSYCLKDISNISWLDQEIPLTNMWCSSLSYIILGEVSQELVESDQSNYVCPEGLTGIHCSYAESRIDRSNWNLDVCNQSCQNSTQWCYTKVGTQYASTSCSSYKRSEYYKYKSYTLLGDFLWTNTCEVQRIWYNNATSCEAVTINWQTKYVFYYTDGKYHYLKHALTKDNCPDNWYENCKLYSCNEYDSRNSYECTYRECTDFWNWCIAYNDVMITTWNYISDSNCYCTQTEGSPTDPENLVYLANGSVDENIFRCSQIEWSEYSEGECYRCTEYSCTVRQWCKQWNTWVNYFYIQNSLTTDPAHLKTTRNEGIYNNAWYETGIIELRLQTRDSNKLITWYHLSINSTNARNRPANENISITMELINENNIPIICEKKTGTYNIKINTWLVTDFAYNPTNALNISWLTYYATYLDYCCDCDYDNPNSTCFPYCCDESDQVCYCAKHPNNPSCLTPPPSIESGFCEATEIFNFTILWECTCNSNEYTWRNDYIGGYGLFFRQFPNTSVQEYCSQIPPTWSGICETEQRVNDTIWNLCTCRPNNYTWRNDYISGNRLFFKQFPNTTTQQYCQNITGFCEATSRYDNTIWKACTCQPNNYNWRNDYISGYRLFFSTFPGMTTWDYCKIEWSCTSIDNYPDKQQRCQQNRNDITYENNQKEYCCCWPNERECNTIRNNLYVNPNYKIQSWWYIPDKDEYPEMHEHLKTSYPLMIWTQEKINGNYQLTCEASLSCPWFKCDESFIKENSLENTSYPKNYSHILPVIGLDVEGYDANWNPKRTSWTGCVIKFITPEEISTETHQVTLSFTLFTWSSAFMAWNTWKEEFYTQTLKQAIHDNKWDKWFFFYISQPQRITYWKNPETAINWVLWDISYDVKFSSWIADEYYYITWTAIIDWYKKELHIKKPTFNYENPNSYLFNFPEY